MSGLITEEIKEALQGFVPSVIATSSAKGVPNITYISQAHYVDEHHLALSWQFFNKTWDNIQENPSFSVVVTEPRKWVMWKINLQLEEVLKEGELFEEMELALEAIASMQGASDVFKLAAILICRIKSVENQFDGLSD